MFCDVLLCSCCYAFSVEKLLEDVGSGPLVFRRAREFECG